MAFRSGFVSIIGRPNAGKSTLLNALVGEKLAIVTPKPQTTRNRIQGIVNIKAAKGRTAGQIVFIDTPGVHKPDRVLNRKMMQEVYDALESRDLILLIVDVTQKFGPGDEFTLELVKRSGGPVFLLLNKVDLIDKQELLPLIDRYRQLHDFREIFRSRRERKTVSTRCSTRWSRHCPKASRISRRTRSPTSRSVSWWRRSSGKRC